MEAVEMEQRPGTLYELESLLQQEDGMPHE